MAVINVASFFRKGRFVKAHKRNITKTVVDFPGSYVVSKWPNDENSYQFENKHGTKYHVDFDELEPGIFEVSFNAILKPTGKRRAQYPTTNEYDTLAVIKSVLKATTMFAAERKPKKFMLSAAYEQSEGSLGSWENKRTRIYKAMLERQGIKVKTEGKDANILSFKIK